MAPTVADVRQYAGEACRGRRNIFGPSFFDEHLEAVAGCATKLAESLGADVEIVQLAAYLQDLSAVRDPATIPDHARLSAELAGEVLSGHGYPPDRAGAFCRCIASHSSPQQTGSASLDEICLSNADAMSRTLRPDHGRSPIEQIQLALGHESMLTTERYFGVRQSLTDAPCDHLGIDPDNAPEAKRRTSR